MGASLAPAPTIETTRISAVVRASSARRPSSEDIPVARRAAPQKRRSSLNGLALLLACLGVMAAGTTAVLLGPGLLVRFETQNQAPLEIDGFRERPDDDGRLLRPVLCYKLKRLF